MLQSLAAGAILRAASKSPVIGFAAGTYGMKTLSTQEALRTIAEIGYDERLQGDAGQARIPSARRRQNGLRSVFPPAEGIAVFRIRGGGSERDDSPETRLSAHSDHALVLGTPGPSLGGSRNPPPEAWEGRG